MSDAVEYKVKEWPNGSKSWYLDGKLHREDGPAVERSDGSKAWYLCGKELSEEAHRRAVAELRNPDPCNGRVVEIDGKAYRLTAIEEDQA